MTLHLSETMVVHEQDIQTRFVRAQGASGNNLHHKAIAVEVRYDIAHAPLPSDVSLGPVSARRAGNYRHSGRINDKRNGVSTEVKSISAR